MVARSPILANMAPPSYRVKIPSGREDWHEVAAPLFVAIAVFFGLWWLARFRTIRSSYGRAILLACIGFVATSYTAWWIWANRDAMPPTRSSAAVLADDMPFFYFCFALIFSLVAQWGAIEQLATDSNGAAIKTNKWRVQLLGTLVAIGFIATLLFAVGRPDMWAPLLAAFSILALAIWVLVLAAVWCMRHYSDVRPRPR